MVKRILIALALLAGLCRPAAAASVVTQSGSWAGNVLTVVLTWTAHTDGTVTAATVTLGDDVWLVAGLTDPGSTAPADNYDLVVSDPYGVDVFGGELMNRDTTTSEQVTPKVGSWYGPRWIGTGPLTVTWSNNSVNAATGRIVLTFTR